MSLKTKRIVAGTIAVFLILAMLASLVAYII